MNDPYAETESGSQTGTDTQNGDYTPAETESEPAGENSDDNSGESTDTPSDMPSTGEITLPNGDSFTLTDLDLTEASSLQTINLAGNTSVKRVLESAEADCAQLRRGFGEACICCVSCS